MVKGISRRVVVLDSPDQRFFEQAIFIVRNDAAGEGITSRELVEEARRVAHSYVAGGSLRPGVAVFESDGLHPDGGRSHRTGMAGRDADLTAHICTDSCAP